MESLLQDLRYGWRVLRSTPATSLIATVTLALGIGANTAIFSIVDAVLLRPLGYASSDRLVMVWEHDRADDRRRNVVNPANFLAWRDHNDVFSLMSGITDTSLNLTGVEDPEEVDVQLVNHELFTMLGSTSLLGRTFDATEDSADGEPVAVLSSEFWHRRFGGDPAIVGQTLILNDAPIPVIGVMPPSAGLVGDEVDIWLPMRFREAHRQFSGRYMRAIALLGPGVSVEQAQASMDTIATRLEQEFPDRNAGWGVNLVPLHEQVTGDVRPALVLLLGAVGMLLLIACANVANLLLARASARQRELAVRASLGAGRSRIVRQLLCEATMLSALGALGGLLLAAGATRLISDSSLAALDIPRLGSVGLDYRVLGFTALAGVFTGLLFGTLPAVESSRPDLTEALKEGLGSGHGHRGRRLGGALIVAEVALAVMLLVGAGLLVRSFAALTRVDPGFEPVGVLAVQLSFPGSKFDSSEAMVAHQAELLERFAAIPGVSAAGSIQFLPIGGARSATSIYPEDRPRPEPGQFPGADVRVVAGAYFDAIGLPLIAGRAFETLDGPDSAKVTIVNRRLADDFWPGESAIGRRVALSWDGWESLEVVGVVENAHHEGLDTAEKPAIYRPLAQDSWDIATILVRTTGDPDRLTNAVVATVREFDPAQPIKRIRPMTTVIAESLIRARLNMLLLAAFAALAASLAAVGIYGVISYVVSERTRELGIRMALGAAPASVYSLVMRQSLSLAALGLVVGLGAAWFSTRLMSSLVFGVTPVDLPTYGAVAILLLAVAAAASFIPAYRGTRVDPAIALRSD